MEGTSRKTTVTVSDYASKVENRLRKLPLFWEADRMKTHLLLLQDDDRDHHAGLDMASVVTEAAYPRVEYDKAGLKMLASCAINTGSHNFVSETRPRIHTSIASKQVVGNCASKRALKPRTFSS